MAETSHTHVAGVSRRRFLRSVGAATVAAAAPRILWGAYSRTSGHTLLGQGSHTYEVVEGWGVLPNGVKYGYTHGVQIDSRGRVHIHNQSPDAVIVFDPEGKFIRSWGKEFAAGAHGMQLRKEGNTEYFYFADIARKIVVKTTLGGEVVWTLPYPKEAGVYDGGKGYTPTNIAFAPNGDFYVADGYGSSYIHQYDIDAKYLRTWGGKGKDPGKMNCPHGIWVDTRGGKPLVLVADRENHRLQYFTLDGRHAGFVTDELRRPCHFDRRGNELLVPDLLGRVTILDKDNKLITHLGDNPDPGKRANPNVPREQWVTGQFCSPHAACWDKEGNIYVVEWLKQGRVTKLRHVG